MLIPPQTAIRPSALRPAQHRGHAEDGTEPLTLDGIFAEFDKALRDALENEVAALVLKVLVEYQVADIAGDRIKID
jgi:hypothetical protein